MRAADVRHVSRVPDNNVFARGAKGRGANARGRDHGPVVRPALRRDVGRPATGARRFPVAAQEQAVRRSRSVHEPRPVARNQQVSVVFEGGR